MKKSNKKKIITIFALLFLCLLGTTCKRKIEKYPFDMDGIWFGSSTGCDFILKINKNSTGQLTCLGGHFCNSEEIASGKIKYTKNNFFVHKEKFVISKKPETSQSNDSIYAPEENDLFGLDKKYRVLAEMKLYSEKAHETIIFRKYINY